MEVGSAVVAKATTSAGTPFAHLLLAVFNSILEVFILCLAGYILARHGILDKRTQKQINRLNVSLFTPALLFSKVAFYLTPEKLKELWIIPIWFIIVTTASMSVGRLLGWVFGLRQSQRSFVMAAAMFMNSNALPIALMQSLVVSVPDLAWGSDDNKNAMLGRALTYLTMYSTLGMIVRYSYGVALLSRADTILLPAILPSDGDPEERAPLLENIDEQEPECCRPSGSPLEYEFLSSHPSASTLAAFPSNKSLPSLSSSPENSRASSPKLIKHHKYPEDQNQLVALPGTITHGLPPSPPHTGTGTGINERLLRPGPTRRNTTFYNSFPNSPNESQTALPTWDEDESTDTSANEAEDGDQITIGGLRGGDIESGSRQRNGAANQNHVHSHDDANGHPHHSPHHSPHHIIHRLSAHLTRWWIAFNNFMTVPLWAAVLSLLVACIDPLKHALQHHMQPLNEAIDVSGKCAVPLTLVVLGAYFYVPPAEGSEGDPKMTKKTWSKSFLHLLRALFRSSSSDPSSTTNHSSRTTANTTANKEAPRPKETLTVALAVASRMVLTPLLLVPLIVWATSEDWHAVFEDPVFVVVNTILLCSPPALTLAQITAAVSGDAFERLISRTIFWSYCVVTPFVTIGCVLFGLWLAEI